MERLAYSKPYIREIGSLADLTSDVVTAHLLGAGHTGVAAATAPVVPEVPLPDVQPPPVEVAPPGVQAMDVPAGPVVAPVAVDVPGGAIDAVGPTEGPGGAELPGGPGGGAPSGGGPTGGGGGPTAGGGGEGGELPFTGFAASMLGALGAAMTAAGVALRKVARR